MAMQTWEQAVEWLRNTPEKQEFAKKCYFDDPIIDAAERFRKSDEWLETQRLLSGHIPGKVLDLGSGRGVASYSFAKLGCQVTSAEPDTSSIVGTTALKKLFQEANLSVTICESFAENLPLESDSFDIVYARSVFHHAKDIKKMAQQVFRVLKPGGVCLFARDHVLRKNEKLEDFLASHPVHHLYGGEMAYALHDYIGALQLAGFQKIRWWHHWGIAINYPTFGEDIFESMMLTSLKKHLPEKLSQHLTGYPWVRAFFREWFGAKFQKPGDLHTFRAIKPL